MTVEEAKAAKKHFDKTFLHSRKIDVQFARTLSDIDLLKDREYKRNKREEQRAASGRKKKEVLTDFLAEMEIDAPKETPGVEGESLGKRQATHKNVATSQRLFIKNIPYQVNKDALKEEFEKYGKVTECIVIMDTNFISKGIGFVSFEEETDAARALASLDNQIVFGRIMHVEFSEKPRREQYRYDDPSNPNFNSEKSSFKRVKKARLMEKLQDDTNWNSLFLNPNTVLDYMADEYGITKKELLDKELDNPGVKIALIETKVINETKEWLKENGVAIDVFESDRANIQRSDTVLLVKNLGKEANRKKIAELFQRYGHVERILLPPNRAICIVELQTAAYAQNCLEKLNEYYFTGHPLYIEYAPIGMLSDGKKGQVHHKKGPKGEEELVRGSTLFVKNFSFDSTTIRFQEFLETSGYPSFKMAKIIFKNEQSCGFGFVEFDDEETAMRALKDLQGQIFDGHKLEISISKPNVQENTKGTKKTEDRDLNSKIVIRNVDFAATSNELRELIENYGDIQSVRMPTKATGEHRGYAFVDFSSVDEAKNALEALKNTHFYGRKLVIEYAKT